MAGILPSFYYRTLPLNSAFPYQISFDPSTCLYTVSQRNDCFIVYTLYHHPLRRGKIFKLFQILKSTNLVS